MGKILTGKDLKESKDLGSKEQLNTAPATKLTRINMGDTWRLKSAPISGKSNVAFFYEGKEISLNIVDQIYKIDSNIKGDDLLKMKAMLVSAGFVEETELVEVPVSDIPEIEDDKNDDDEKINSKTVYVLFHPDSTDDEPINTQFSLNGVDIEVVEGIVRIEDPNIVQDLIDSGYKLIKEEVVIIDDDLLKEEGK